MEQNLPQSVLFVVVAVVVVVALADIATVARAISAYTKRPYIVCVVPKVRRTQPNY